MLKKTIKYTDYNDVEREEDFYFHLSKAELIEMEYGEHGSFVDYIDKITREQDNHKLVQLWKKIVLDAYGVKSEDGKRFIKNQEVRDSFAQTEAYTELFMELAGDAKKAADFINGILPKDIREEAKKALNS